MFNNVASGGGDDPKEWNINPNEAETSLEKRNSALELSSSYSIEEFAVSVSPRKVPKFRSSFTLTSAEVMKDFFDFDLSNIGQGDMDFEVFKVGTTELSDDSASSATISSRRPSHHGSLENLHKPKNHRSTAKYNWTTKPKLARNAKDKELSRLADDNTSLSTDLEEMRKKALLFRTAAAFSLSAFRFQLKTGRLLQIAKKKKDEEAAARMILHTLLLNSWRKTKGQLVVASKENFQLAQNIDNLSLQLRVVRHVQALDKEKIAHKLTEVERLEKEVKRLTKEDVIRRATTEKIEGELNSLQASIQNLEDLNKLYKDDILQHKEDLKKVNYALDMERDRSRMMEKDYMSLKNEREQLEEKVSEFSRQCKQWQERARNFESEAWGMKMEGDGKDRQIQEVQRVCLMLKKEVSDHIKAKTIMDSRLAENVGQLDKAEAAVEEGKKQLEDALLKIEALKENNEKTEKECARVKTDLLFYQMQNVKRRRDWGNALFFIVSPFGALRRYLSPPPQPKAKKLASN